MGRLVNQGALPFDERCADAAVPESPAQAASAAAALAVEDAVEFVRHPRARRYLLRVRPDGSVRVTIPRWGSKRQAAAFASSQSAWIAKQRARADVERRQAAAAVAMPIGRERTLRALAKRELPIRLQELAQTFGLNPSRVSIRNQRWRWGSCSPDGHICLNWRLVAMPPYVRDYVLVHELMHLKRLDHSPKFWKLVAAACPSYQDARAWLRAYRPT